MHRFEHLFHRPVETQENGATHDRVPDVQLLDFRYGCDWCDVSNGESMTRVNREAEIRAAARGIAQRVYRVLRVRTVRVAAGVKLYCWNAELLRLLYC